MAFRCFGSGAFLRDGSGFAFAAAPATDGDEERRLTAAALAIGWLGQLALGLMLAQLAPVPERPLLIDRGRCDPAGRRQLVARYSGLHRHDALQMQRFRPVWQSGVFALQRYPSPPDPGRLAALAAVGQGDPTAAAALRRRFPTALLLACELAVPGAGGAP